MWILSDLPTTTYLQVEDYLMGFFLFRTCQETLKINSCLLLALVMRNGNLVIFLSLL